jgi:quinol monooxygenase YgiN
MMAEIHLIARAVARKGKETELRTLLQEMLAPTHAEPGCRLYELYQSNSPERFYFHERWESQAALDRHMATPHFKRMEQSAKDLLAQPFEVNILAAVSKVDAAA